MRARRHRDGAHQRVGPQDGSLRTALQGGPPALIEGVEQYQNGWLRGLDPHPHLFGRIALDPGKAVH